MLTYLKHGVKNVKVTNVQYYIVLPEEYRCKVHILLPLMIFRQNTRAYPPTYRFYDTTTNVPPTKYKTYQPP